MLILEKTVSVEVPQIFTITSLTGMYKATSQTVELSISGFASIARL